MNMICVNVQDVYKTNKEKVLLGERLVFTTLDFDTDIHHRCQFFIAFQEPSPLISWALNIYNQNQCGIFLFLLRSMDLVSQLQICVEIAANFVNGVFFLPRI